MNFSRSLSEQFASRGFAELPLAHGLASRLVSLNRRFYDSSLESRYRDAAVRTNGVLGYSPSETEAEALSALGVAVPHFEGHRRRGYSSFDFIGSATARATTPLFASCPWPKEHDFRREAQRLYSDLASMMRAVSSHVLLECAEQGWSLQQPLPTFDDSCCSIMRLLRYAPRPDTGNSKEHTDYEFLTLVVSDRVGLQTRNASGDLYTAPLTEGCGILLAGDMMEVVTQGRIRSTPHFVSYGGQERLSTIFFQGLRYDYPVPGTISADAGAKVFGQHLCGMLVRGAPHLQVRIGDWEAVLGCKIPERNPYFASRIGLQTPPQP